MARQRTAHTTTFDDFFAAFGKSVHADIQLRDGEVVLAHSHGLLNEALGAEHSSSTMSTGHPRPLTRTSSTAQKLPHLSQERSPSSDLPNDKRPPRNGSLPSHLAALVSLQASDGSWQYDDKFQFVLHDIAPLPPEGIPPKLWAIAVVVTIFRQCPECFASLESSYDKAMLHVDDDILRLAKAQVDTSGPALERIRPYQNNEAKEIRERLAREAAAKRAAEDAEEHRLELERKQTIYISKYSLYRARQLPMDTQELMRSTLQTDLQAIFPTKQHTNAARQLRPREMEIQSGDAVECCWRRVDGSKLPQRHAQWRLCRVRAINANGKTLDVQYLDDPFERERNVPFQCVRLLPDDAKDRRGLAFDRLRQQWIVPIGLEDELGRLQEIEAKRRWRSPWQLQVLPALPTTTETQTRQHDTALVSSTRPRLTVPPQSLHKPLIDAAHEELYHNAVTATLAYDQLYTRLLAVVKAVTKRYASAVLFQERLHAFDEFLDVAVAVVQLSVTALEQIEQWVNLAPPTEQRLFIWHGHDFIVQLLRSFDFLSTQRTVCEWYGDEFAFSMNPFLMAASVRDRVHDHGLQFTSKLQPLAPEKALRVALRMHKREIESLPSSASDTPSWWPHARYDEDLLGRVKQCETFVLSYLRSAGYLTESIA